MAGRTEAFVESNEPPANGLLSPLKPSESTQDAARDLCRDSDDLLRGDRGAQFESANDVAPAAYGASSPLGVQPTLAEATFSGPEFAGTNHISDMTQSALGDTLVPASVPSIPPPDDVTPSTANADTERTAGIGLAAMVSSFVAESQTAPVNGSTTATAVASPPQLSSIVAPPPAPPAPPSTQSTQPVPPPEPAPNADDQLDEGGSMTIIEHLEELRRRLFVSAVAIVLGSVVGWFLVPAILSYLQDYAPGVTFISTTVLGPLALKIKLSFLIGLVVGSPAILYEIWAFVAPGLTRKERRYAIPFSLLGSLLFAGGAATGLFVIPLALRFLLLFFPELHLGEFIDINGYVMFIALIAIIFGVTFELPIFMTGFSLIGLTSSQFFIKRFKIAIFIMYGVAMIITPGVDFVSPLVLGTILTVLYWVGVLLIRIVGR